MIVYIRDFNCINSIQLEFNPGFTVIQGPSNSGKSSVIKAIEKCIFNQSGSTNVRQGKDNLLVGIKYKDQEVYLTKGKNTKYKVNNQIFEKIGVNQLEHVAEALNIREVVLGGEKVRLNFSNQFSYPFLLDKTPGQLYKFIVDSAESESLSEVLKDISKDIKDLDKSIIQNEAKIDILNSQHKDLEIKLKDADKIIEVSNEVINLDSTYTLIERQVELKDKYIEIKNAIATLDTLLDQLKVDIDTSDLDIVKQQYLLFSDAVDRYNTTQEHIDRLKNLYKGYISVDIDQLDIDKESYMCIVNSYSKYESCKDSIFNLKASIEKLDESLRVENNKLDGFDVCPLCGTERKDCHE